MFGMHTTEKQILTTRAIILQRQRFLNAKDEKTRKSALHRWQRASKRFKDLMGREHPQAWHPGV